MDDEVISILDLPALEQIRLERRRTVEMTAKRLAASPVTVRDLRLEWEHDQATRALQSVEAEIAKRKSVL